MFSPLVAQIVVFMLVAVAVFAVAYAFLYSSMTGDRSTERIDGVSMGSTAKQQRKTANAGGDALNTRKKQVQETIADMEAREKAKKKVSLRIKLQRAGLDATPQQFWIVSAITGVGVGVFVLLMGSSLLVSLLAAFGGGFGLPNWVLNFLFKRRKKRFLQEFANAIDVIVRGVKSGLPLNDCLGIISRESPEPICTEFAALVEQQRVGVPLSECFDRMMIRMPLEDVNFFAIVVAIQQQAGGNLSEALGNLSGVLRDRKRLENKVQALSSEAKASAMILGALPFMVMLGVYVTSPDYIAMLWRERVGHFMMVGAGLWMTCGLLVMRKMINFKY
jgi:tight adherence protein B